MANFPPPDWLTLPETLAHLKALGFAEAESKEALSRAIQEDLIKTQGRGAKHDSRDLILPLWAGDWDRAAVDWARSTLTKPERGAFYPKRVTDVSISRRSLERWLARAGVVVVEPEAAPARQPEADAASPPMSEAASEQLAKRVFDQMRQNGDSGGGDILAERLREAAREQGKYITRERGRELASKLGADIKRRPGRPAKNSAAGNTAKK